MLIDSGYQGFGFFGQICSWILDLLPYCDEQGWQRAHWRIRSKLYGDPPDYNIFDSVIETVYTPESDPPGKVMFEDLHWQFNPRDGAGWHFHGDYQRANKIWNSYFRFRPWITDFVDKFFQVTGLGEGTLGLHYRGTDQFVISEESNRVTIDEFMLVLRDYLTVHPAVRNIFACSDDANFPGVLKEFCFGKYELYMYEHARSLDHHALYRFHDEAINRSLAVEAIRDCVSLSKCQYVLANFSALSAWAKLLNPDLDSQRISACKIMSNAFPHGYAPFYTGQSDEAKALLARLREGDWEVDGRWGTDVRREVTCA